MDNVTFDQNARINGCRVLRLESDLLRLDILPEAGGKIYRWLDKPIQRDWLWQHPQIPPARHSTGENYDDVFSGGWDELFPNGEAGIHDGVSSPDHCEYWAQDFEWDVEPSSQRITLHLSANGPITPTRMERWITLEAGSPAANIRYRLTHLGDRPLDYLWSLHPALNINSNCRLVIPGEKAINGAPGLGRLAAESVEFRWPLGPGKNGQEVDLSKIPASDTPEYDMAYLTETRDGWFALLDEGIQAGFGIAFDRSIFTCAWFFQTYGGWWGIRTAIVEPCTGYSGDLAQASTSGRCARLKPRQVLETQVKAICFRGGGRIRRLGLDGKVAWHENDASTRGS